MCLLPLIEVLAGVPHLTVCFLSTCQVGFSLTRVRSGSIRSYSVSGRGGSGERRVEGPRQRKGRVVCRPLKLKGPWSSPREEGRDSPLSRGRRRGWGGRQGGPGPVGGGSSRSGGLSLQDCGRVNVCCLSRPIQGNFMAAPAHKCISFPRKRFHGL